MTDEAETPNENSQQPNPARETLQTWAQIEHLRLWRRALDQGAEQLKHTRGHFWFVSVLVSVQTLLLLAWIVAWCVRT